MIRDLKYVWMRRWKKKEEGEGWEEKVNITCRTRVDCFGVFDIISISLKHFWLPRNKSRNFQYIIKFDKLVTVEGLGNLPSQTCFYNSVTVKKCYASIQKSLKAIQTCRCGNSLKKKRKQQAFDQEIKQDSRKKKENMLSTKKKV